MARQLTKRQPVKPVKINKTKRIGASENAKSSAYQAVGRRKVATARVRLYPRPGTSMVNRVDAQKYFSQIPFAAKLLHRPFTALGIDPERFSFSAKVVGSGIRAQLDAVLLGISRSLVKLDAANKKPLKDQKLLTRDARMKESRKVGTGGKARRHKQSPKR